MKRIFQWGLLTAVIAAGTLAFMLLCGEDDPHNPMPAGRILLIKAGAAAALYGCCRLGRLLYRRGMLPQAVIDELSKED